MRLSVIPLKGQEIYPSVIPLKGQSIHRSTIPHMALRLPILSQGHTRSTIRQNRQERTTITRFISIMGTGTVTKTSIIITMTSTHTTPIMRRT
jgi:hypothetical protein